MATKAPAKKKGRRWIDYPRAGRSGFRRWLPSWKLLLGTFVTLIVVAFIGLSIAVATTQIPKPNDLAVAQTTRVYYDDGKTEIGRIGEANRTSVPLDRISPQMQAAMLAAEDRGYYSHGGFDPRGLARAAWNNITGGTVQGASTITQQYAKNAYLSQEQSFSRKFKELVLSVKLETQSSKDEILADYLNTIYYGRGAYGIQAASRAYFGKSASKLDAAESAYLAAIIRAPSFYASKKGQADLRTRWDYVVDGMVITGALTQSEADALVFPEPIPWSGAYNYFKGPNGYLLESARLALLDLGYTDDDINLNGYRVTTTINKQAQDAAIAAVRDYGPTYNTEGLRIGLASVRPGTGEIVAMYGGKNYLRNQLNDATQSTALAGSTFKPFALTAALEQDIGLYSTWDGSSPRTIEGYTLQNYGNVSYGTVTLLKATENSINTPYVELGLQVGTDNVRKAAIKAGVPRDTTGLKADPTTVLGTASPTALDMANAYATFAARGERADPQLIKQVKTPDKQTDYELDVDTKREFDQTVMDNVNFALQQVVNVGTGTTALGLGRPSAGKTGTTDNNMSAWYVGYTPQLSTAVMMAKSDKNGNMVTLEGTGGLSSVTGGSFPAQMWTAFNRGALEGLPVETFEMPGEWVGGGGSTVAPSPTTSVSESPSGLPTDEITPSGEVTESPTAQPTQTPTQAPAATTAPAQAPRQPPTEVAPPPTSQPAASP
ncbi:MAG: penicillin-binding protein [Actinobacteria bacterium]|jgi:membrane peptidoglycan carboxypeptidase|nr:penicillin-binding protein [Actinomycetota bacterium]HPJ18770.1 transglycosylase domain-containing protein [Actinomycetota bacterium]